MPVAVRLKHPKQVQVLKLKYFIFKIMEPRLNHFSEKELIFLGLMAEEKVKDYEAKIESCLKLPEGEVRNDLYNFYRGQLDMAEMWNAQSAQASLQVKARNILLNDN